MGHSGPIENGTDNYYCMNCKRSTIIYLDYGNIDGPFDGSMPHRC